MLHAYSLVHDDLPAMDDDDLRRGKPTTHKAFDEATAILAGDALQTRAFEVLAEPDTHSDPQARCELVAALGAAAGARGMAGGQMIDMLAEGQTLDAAEVTRLQALKTGPADPVQRRGRRDPGPGRGAAAPSAGRLWPRPRALRSRSPTTCWMPRAPPRRPARRPARTRRPGKATMVVGPAAWSGPGHRRDMLAEQAAAHLDGFGDRGATALRRWPPSSCARAELSRSTDEHASCHEPVSTPLLDRVRDPGRSAQLLAPSSCGSSPTSCGRRPIDAVSVTGGHLGAGARRGRADGGAALRCSTRRATG